MKRSHVRDERVLLIHRKIQSEAYLLTAFLAAISIFIKAYVLDLPVGQYAAELGILALSLGYIALRSALLGHDLLSLPASRAGRLLLPAAVVVLSGAVAAANGVRHYAQYGSHYTGIWDGRFLAVVAVSFLSCAIFLSAVLGSLWWLNRKGQERLERKLEDGEE